MGDMRSNWQFETCHVCTREQRLAWGVSDALWDCVVWPQFKRNPVCLECFLRMADDRDIDVQLRDITLAGLVFARSAAE